MKPMKDKRMDMSRGEVDSEAFFPESAHHKKMPRAGEIKDFKYPDTEEAVHRDQESFVKDASRAQPKQDFRH